MPALPSTQDSRPLLERILETPHLAHIVPQLPPEVLHRVIQRCGLEDCSELVTLATPTQLARVFDLDLWSAGQPGVDEQFDAARFGVWLEVLMESGATVAAKTVAGMDAALVSTALAQHARVFDPGTLEPAVSTDDEQGPVSLVADGGQECEVGGYRMVAKQIESWDAIVAVLIALSEAHAVYFHRVMRGCRNLSNSDPELDGLDDLPGDQEQGMFNLALDRERRREQQGFATPAQARAFLQMSRQLTLDAAAAPPKDAVAEAYFRAIEWANPAEESSEPRRLLAAAGAPQVLEASAESVSAFLDVLAAEGVLPQPPRALLDEAHGGAPRLARIQAQMQLAAERNYSAYSTRSQELAYLANAIAAGCSVQARSFTVEEATDAAVAACNLGLENWPPHWRSEEERRGSGTFLVDHDLVRVFQVGWTVLYRDVCMYAAKQLIDVLTQFRCDDREIQKGLKDLRIEMTKQRKAGTPWRARDALDVMTTLDMPAWAALLGLIGECPVLHAGIGASRDARTLTVSPSAFEFIAGNGQIAAAGVFLQALPAILRG